MFSETDEVPRFFQHTSEVLSLCPQQSIGYSGDLDGLVHADRGDFRDLVRVGRKAGGLYAQQAKGAFSK